MRHIKKVFIKKHPLLKNYENNEIKNTVSNSCCSTKLFIFVSDSITNKVINDNVGELFEDLRPVLEEVITQIIENLIFKSLESQVPFDILYAKE